MGDGESRDKKRGKNKTWRGRVGAESVCCSAWVEFSLSLSFSAFSPLNARNKAKEKTPFPGVGVCRGINWRCVCNGITGFPELIQIHTCIHAYYINQ